MNVGRIVGIILIVVGLGVCAVAGVLSVVAAETAGGRVLGIAFGLILAVPLVGVGVFLLVRGQSEEKAMAVVRQQRKLLGMIDAQGKVSIAHAALELNEDRAQVKGHVYDLVNKGLFTGYVNWDQGELISFDASKIDTHKCPHCGAQLELAGKGVIQCPYCGTEIFMRKE